MADDQIPQGWSREEWAEAERYAAGVAAGEGEQIEDRCDCLACRRERQWKATVAQQLEAMEAMEARRRLGEDREAVKVAIEEALVGYVPFSKREPAVVYEISLSLHEFHGTKDRQAMRRLVSEKLQAVGDAIMKAWEERYVPV